MKILVMSDSHSGLSFMRCCIDRLKPDALIHLGDYYDDAQTVSEEYPHLMMYQVPGNCDRYRCPLLRFTDIHILRTVIGKKTAFGY